MNGLIVLRPAVLTGITGGCAAERTGTKDPAFAGTFTDLSCMIDRLAGLIDKL